MSDAKMSAQELLTLYAEAQSQQNTLAENSRKLRGPVEDAIHEAFTSTSEAAQVLQDRSHAIQALQSNEPNHRFGAILALTFIHRDTSDEFKNAVMSIAAASENWKLRALAVVAIGNIFAGSNDAVVNDLLTNLTTIASANNASNDFIDALSLARERVTGIAPIGPQFQFLQEKRGEIATRSALRAIKLNALREQFGTDFPNP